jgi:hypothetical protein
VGEIDPLGTRRDGLDAFLDQKVEEGWAIETRAETHAIIFRQPKGLKRFTSGRDPGRYVVQVDEAGNATMHPAEPRRTWATPRRHRALDILRHVWQSHPHLERGQDMTTKDKNTKKSMEKKPAQKTLKEKRQAKKAKK